MRSVPRPVVSRQRNTTMPKSKPAVCTNELAELVDQLGDLAEDLRTYAALNTRAEKLKAQIKERFGKLRPTEGTTITGKRFQAVLSAMGERDELDLEAAHAILGADIWSMMTPHTSKVVAALKPDHARELTTRKLTGPRSVTVTALPKARVRKATTGAPCPA